MGMECTNETAVSLRDWAIIEQSESNIEQDGDGHYKVMLPWNSKKQLGSNYAQAEVRLEQIERKLKRDPALRKEYQEAEECPQKTVVPFIMCLIMSRSDQNEKQPRVG